MSFGRIYHSQGSSFRNNNNRRSSSNRRNTRDSSAKYNAIDHGNNYYAPNYHVPYGWNLNFRDFNFANFDNAKPCEAQPLKRRKFSDSEWEGCGNYYHQFNAYETAPSISNAHIAEPDYVHDPTSAGACTVASSNKRDRSKLEDEDSVFDFMSKDQIERCSPSRKDGIDALREKHLRYSYCAFLRNLGFRLDLPQKTIATAMVLCHRFFVRRSHACHDRYLIATATLFLASKSEESARPLNNVLRASCEILQKQDLSSPSCMPPDWFDQYRERVLDAEQLILTTLDFELNVQHPHVPLTSILNKLGLAQSVLVNLALHLLSEGLRSSLWLQFKPHQIAAGAVYLAAKFLNWDLTALQYVWKEFQATPGVLQDVAQQLMEVV